MILQLQAIKAIAFSLWEKVLPFVVKHWKILLILALSAVLFSKMRADYKALEDAMEVARSSYEAQLKGIKTIHEDEIQRRQELLDEYLVTIKELEENYDLSRDEIERERSRRIDEIEREWSVHPAGVAEKIEEEFGFGYVE